MLFDLKFVYILAFDQMKIYQIKLAGEAKVNALEKHHAGEIRQLELEYSMKLEKAVSEESGKAARLKEGFESQLGNALVA